MQLISKGNDAHSGNVLQSYNLKLKRHIYI